MSVVVNVFSVNNVADLNVFNVVNVCLNAKIVNSVAPVVVIAQEFVNVVSNLLRSRKTF